MSEKKVVGRNVAIGLGIVSIIIVACLIGAFAYYIPLLNDRDETISSLNIQIVYKDNQIQTKNSTINSLQTQVNNLQTQLNNLASSLVNALAFRNASEVLYNSSELEPPYNLGIDLPVNFTSGIPWGEISIDRVNLYPGIVVIHVSSDHDTYVTATFTSQGHDFFSQVHVGMNGTAAFTIAPPDDSKRGIDITVSTSDTITKATANITLTYIY